MMELRSIYRSIYPSIYQSIYLSKYLSIYLSKYNLNINPSIYLSKYLSIHPSIHPDNVSRCILGDSSRGISRSISGGISEDWMAEQKPLAKVVDLVSLGELFGPRALDPDLALIRVRA